MIVLHINGMDLNMTLDGKSSYVFDINSSSWTVGSYIFNVTYDGDGNYSAVVSSNYYYNVTNASSILTSANVTVVYGANGSVDCVLFVIKY